MYEPPSLQRYGSQTDYNTHVQSRIRFQGARCPQTEGYSNDLSGILTLFHQLKN